MKTLVLYSSRYGSTEKCANLIMKRLNGKADAVNVKNLKIDAMDSYDTILIGGGIYAGRFQSEITEFVKRNEEYLRSRKVGVFLCCKEGEKITEYIKTNLPDWLTSELFILEHLGHEINIDKLNFMGKFLFKTLFKVKESYSDLKYDSIDRIVNTINA
jgi:menaquinone-dependent protoporphyrinogen oxidase